MIDSVLLNYNNIKDSMVSENIITDLNDIKDDGVLNCSAKKE
jgi:hypothetical protein